MKKLILPLIATMGLLLGSCEKNTVPTYLENEVVTINAYNTSAGKTRIAGTNLYIGSANVFVADNSIVLYPCGRTNGIAQYTPTATDPLKLTRECDVMAGEQYHIYNYALIKQFPSGKLAYSVNSLYRRLYVESYINTGEVTTGAVIQYTTLNIPDNGLLPNGTIVGSLMAPGSKFEMTIPDDVELYTPNSYLGISYVNGHLTITAPTVVDYSITDVYKFLLRKGSSYTELQIQVNITI